MKKEIITGFILLCFSDFRVQAAVIADWQFENNLNDSSGNGYTLTGGTGFGYSSNVPGPFINPGSVPDTASYKPGSTPSTLAPNTVLNQTFGTGSFTVQAFVYLNPGATQNFQTVLTDQDTTNKTGIYFSVGSASATSPNSSSIAGYNGSNTAVSKTVGTGLTDGIWYEVAWVGIFTPGSGTAIQFYVNGAVVGTQAFFAESAGISVAASSANWQIGGPTNNFNGLIDNIEIDNTALTPAQFMTAVAEPRSTGLLGLAACAGLIFHVARKRIQNGGTTV